MPLVNHIKSNPYSPFPQVIRFHFSHLDLGLKYHNPCSEREDRVTITEILPSGPHEFCVLPNTKTYVTPSHVARVAFYSNDEIDGQGFRAFYSAGECLKTSRVKHYNVCYGMSHVPYYSTPTIR